MIWKPFTTDWEKARRGKLTSSKISCLLVEGKSESGLGAGALTYCMEQVAELLTGGSYDFSNHSTDWGDTWEPEAVERLNELYPGIQHYGKEFFPLTDWSGGSPDAVYLSRQVNKTFECKCPENPRVHLEYCMIETQEQLKKKHPDHYAQAQMNMLVVAKRFDIPRDEMHGGFVSYHPYFAAPTPDDVDMSLFLLHLKPDLEVQDRILKMIPVAEKEMGRILNKMDVVFKERL